MSTQPERVRAEVIDLAAVRERMAGAEPWLSKREIAQHVGFSVRWVNYRVAEGMPHARMGGHLRFRRSVVEKWLHERAEST